MQPSSHILSAADGILFSQSQCHNLWQYLDCRSVDTAYEKSAKYRIDMKCMTIIIYYIGMDMVPVASSYPKHLTVHVLAQWPVEYWILLIE